MRSALLHTVGDAAASLGVAAAGAVILITGGLYWLDPVMSLVIGVLIATQAWKLLRSTTAVLLEGTPEGLDVAALASVMAKVPGSTPCTTCTCGACRARSAPCRPTSCSAATRASRRPRRPAGR